MQLHRAIVATPLGDMHALASDDALCALDFDIDARHDRLQPRLRRWFAPYTIDDRETRILERTRQWLSAYFRGLAPDPRAVPIETRGTPFERRVWTALVEIPLGRTSTYGAIARQLRCPGASRAVGLANGANPIAILVPCHRVVGASGALTGYGGGLDRKRWLLEHEAGATRLDWHAATCG